MAEFYSGHNVLNELSTSNVLYLPYSGFSINDWPRNQGIEAFN